MGTAGFDKINQSMLNPFPGGPLGPSPSCEVKLVEDNQRFAVAALHLETGRVVTHTDAKSAEEEVPQELWAASSRMMFSIPTMGQPLQHAHLQVRVLMPSYILLAFVLLWWRTGIVFSTFAVASFWVIKPSTFTNMFSLVGLAILLHAVGLYLYDIQIM